ncbi:hypothetical protein CPU12_13065 [Malaciobacter molluscorum LMG 25693]|uniref:histidine kinase n=1 Tax=Malaciobacter molluscorum LMG 25693 TaxID=870501 RepID=A0A2G1DEH9_9BACT|nr:PAS domain S-box protein [Malaciobacter molluscorum]AXX91167.1 PAS sensor-containing signal transduction histidine kinase [Malaciobacter molluscorum LMG 25693]PHO16905.1 hypothetical protein CPU12_13065 [Malaciobacter molluscorum LMG 25693]
MNKFEEDELYKYLNITKGLYLILDKSGNILFANEKVCNTVEVSFERIKKMNWIETFIPNDLKSYISNILKQISNKDVRLSEYVENEILTIKGEKRFISWKNSYIEENGVVTKIICSGEDKTKTKEIELYLEEKEERLKAIFDFSPLGIFITDKTGNILEANLAFLNMLGYSKEEILGRNYIEITHDDNINLNEEKFNQLVDNEIGIYKISKKYIKKNKHLIWVNATVSTIKDQYNEVLYVLAIIEDITEIKSREEHIIAQRRYLHTIIDQNPNIIIVKDYDGKFVLANQAIARLYDTTVENMVGKKDEDFFQNKEIFRKKIEYDKKLIDNNETKIIYEDIEDKVTGKLRNFQSIKKTITGISGEKQVLIISNDITDIKETQKKLKDNEEMLHHQSKMAAMGEMLENIAHQWRQPLSVITTSASSVRIHKELGTLTDDFLDEVLDAIVKSGTHLSQTIDDFRDFFKPNRKKVVFDISQCYQKAIFLVSSKLKNREIEIVENIQSVSIYGFDNELIQVIMNLINNATDAIDDNKDLTSKYIFVDIYKDDLNNAIFKILDNAGGIKEDIKDKIFEPYFTTKHKSLGTGIGLYMSEEILVKHMNGEIKVKNKEFEYKKNSYKGAEFILKIPIEEDKG